METINTPYDDAFRTLLQDCPELVIPLINELFGTDYTGQEVVLSSTNEIFIRNPNRNTTIWNARARRTERWKFGCGSMTRRSRC